VQCSLYSAKINKGMVALAAPKLIQGAKSKMRLEAVDSEKKN